MNSVVVNIAILIAVYLFYVMNYPFYIDITSFKVLIIQGPSAVYKAEICV